MSSHPGRTTNPLLEQTINERLRGQGLDLSPFFGAQRQFLSEQSRASESAQQRQAVQQAVTTGTGRSGAVAAGQRGISATAAGQRRGVEAQLGLQEQIQMQQAIQNALAAGLSLEQIGISREQLDLQREQLREQIRQQNQAPGIFEILGGVAGLGAGLFGAQGAFPKVFGGGGGNAIPKPPGVF